MLKHAVSHTIVDLRTMRSVQCHQPPALITPALWVTDVMLSLTRYSSTKKKNSNGQEASNVKVGQETAEACHHLAQQQATFCSFHPTRILSTDPQVFFL